MTEAKNDPWHKEAAAVARQFVMMLNGAMLYGCGHPNVAKNAAAFCEQLNASFHHRDMITFIVANGNLMVEDWPLDKSFNVGKILLHFDKLALTSISFARGVGDEAIVRLVAIIGNAADIESRRSELSEVIAGSIPRVRVNYVLFGKIKADEVVVKESEARTTASVPNVYGPPPGYYQQQQYPPQQYQQQQYPPPQQHPPQQYHPQAAYQQAAPPQYAPSAQAINYDDAFLPPVTAGGLSRESLSQIEEVLTLSSLIERPKEISAALAQADAGRAGELFGKIRSEIDGAAPEIGVDTLLQSLYSMKQDLYEAIEVQKATGKIMHSTDAIDREINDLTSRAIVKLIRDEYKSGKTPLNRLAHTIRRMLPSSAELMQILPNLKEMLLADGMTLGDYLELVNMLGLKMESEALSESLKDAAESMGASVSDLVSAIQSKPEEAARLILLASEIRQGAGAGDGAPNLSDVLTGYIEDVCTKMAVETCSADGGGAIKQVLAQLQTQVFGQLAQQQSIPPDVMNDIKQRLSERFSDTLASATGALPEGKKRETAAKGAKIKMPPESLNPNNLFFLLNKEIKRSIRYRTPFSTVLVSIEKVNRADGTSAPPGPNDTAELLPQVFVPIEALLRDVDLIGTLGADAPELFMLLPMTGEEGTAVVKERIINKTAESVFTIAGQETGATIKASSASPNENTKDLKTYMALVRANHRKERYEAS